MESRGKYATFKMMQNFVKLDQFDGTNFTCWKAKMMFLLTALKVAYVLDEKLEVLPDPKLDDIQEMEVEQKKGDEDELVCRGHILKTVSDRLYDLFTLEKSLSKICEALEFKYKAEKQGANNLLVTKLFEFNMLDNASILDQVHELQILVNKLRDLNVVVSDELLMGAIITKFPYSWNDYRNKPLNTSEDFTLSNFRNISGLKRKLAFEIRT